MALGVQHSFRGCAYLPLLQLQEEPGSWTLSGFPEIYS